MGRPPRFSHSVHKKALLSGLTQLLIYYTRSSCQTNEAHNCNIHWNKHRHHWAAVVFRCLAKVASSCRLRVSLSCAVLCLVLSLQSRSSLRRLPGLSCRLFLSYGLQVVLRELHRSSRIYYLQNNVYV